MLNTAVFIDGDNIHINNLRFNILFDNIISKDNVIIKRVYGDWKLESMNTFWDKHIFSSIPIQYLSGISYWRDLKLEVSNKVLIPRPETELIIDVILRRFKNKSEKITFVDLGTGSGAISIALALANPNWDGIATDIDKNAIDIASRNFSNNSNDHNPKILCRVFFDFIKNKLLFSKLIS